MFDQREYNRQYRARCRERILAQKKAYRGSNKEKIRTDLKVWREQSRETLLPKKRIYRENNKESVRRSKQRCTTRNRLKVLAQYSDGSMKCAQCTVDDFDMLVLDHVNGGGKAHIRKIGGPGGLCVKMIQEGFPPILQVLCANHNQKKDMERRRGLQIIDACERERRNLLRISVLSHYSGGVPRCAACGETDIDVLVLDHINDDGAQHRRDIGGTRGNLYKALIKVGLPGGLAVLCANHNHKKEMERRRNVV